ncbi:uncharacterized protein LOC125959372 [Anopheles darlingi]|uniref:uncharacterized protein LOC125959372 n=1 Tax=Anopheles darlingi TaxID=43151 RepID=UPI0021001E27|nr:uncharacterized protein LOC125959372 [Anopheles darlingi]
MLIFPTFCGFSSRFRLLNTHSNDNSMILYDPKFPVRASSGQRNSFAIPPHRELRATIEPRRAIECPTQPPTKEGLRELGKFSVMICECTDTLEVHFQLDPVLKIFRHPVTTLWRSS